MKPVHNYIFPESYSFWLGNRLPGKISETLVDCQNCSMVQPQGITRDPGPFLANLKCCTYFPYLPNFTIGKLSSEIFSIASNKGILLPVGLYPGIEYQRHSLQQSSTDFGKNKDLLCPFFKDNQCSIWQFRPGVCTSYFCKSNKGKQGLQLWSDIENYLNHFEWTLATEVMRRMNLEENELAYCHSAIDPDTEDEERKYFIENAWGKWSTKKMDFYSEALKIAMQVQPKDLDTLLDEEFIVFEKALSKTTK